MIFQKKSLFLIHITNERRKLKNSGRALWRKALLKPGLCHGMLFQRQKKKIAYF